MPDEPLHETWRRWANRNMDGDDFEEGYDAGLTMCAEMLESRSDARERRGTLPSCRGCHETDWFCMACREALQDALDRTGEESAEGEEPNAQRLGMFIDPLGVLCDAGWAPHDVEITDDEVRFVWET